jgi:ubiquinone biosynthesis protein
MSAMLRAFTDGLRKHKLQCPAEIVLMIKALTTIEGVAEDLDPAFDLVQFARPHVERLVKQQYSWRVIKGRMTRNVGKWVTLADRLPGGLNTILERVSSNKFRLALDVVGVESVERTIHHSSRQLAYSMLVAAMIMASSILVLASERDQSSVLLGWIGFVSFLVSFSLALMIVIESLWSKFKRRHQR